MLFLREENGGGGILTTLQEKLCEAFKPWITFPERGIEKYFLYLLLFSNQLPFMLYRTINNKHFLSCPLLLLYLMGAPLCGVGEIAS